MALTTQRAVEDAIRHLGSRLEVDELRWAETWSLVREVWAALSQTPFRSSEEKEQAWRLLHSVIKGLKDRSAQEQVRAREQVESARSLVVRARAAIEEERPDASDTIAQARAALQDAKGAPKTDVDELWAELKLLESTWRASLEEHSRQLDERIDELAASFDRARSGEVSWGDVWAEVRAIREAFKGVRFRSREARQAAWESFQLVVDRIAADRKEREFRSETLSREIRNASPTIVTLRIPGGDVEQELRYWSGQLRDAWDLFKEHKNDLLPKDRNVVYQELKDAQDALDEAWSEHRETKQAAWRERVEANLDKNRTNLAELREKEARMSERASELESQIADAWSDSFRDRAEGWLADLEEKLSSIREHIIRVEGWIEEDEGRLSD